MPRPEAERRDAEDRDLEAPPPLLGSWRNLYVAVLAELAAVVALLYALTRWAS